MSRFHRFMLLALILTAQLLPAETSVLVTLGSVGDRIRSQNPELAAARLRIREALGRMHQSGRLKNPELETAFQAGPASREGAFEIGLSQRFPVTDRLRLEKELSFTELKSAEIEVREAERRIVAEASETVVQLLATRQRRALLEKQSILAREFADFLSEIATKGEGSVIDAGQAKLEASSLAMEIRQLDAADTALLGALKPLLGMKPGESLSVEGSLPDTALPAAPADPARRPDFQIAQLDVQAASQGLALEQARRFDDLEGGLFAGVERTEDVPVGYENEAIIGLRFKMPLPFWNKNQGAIEEAEARKQRKELEATTLAGNIHLEAEAARAEMLEWKRLTDEITTTLLPLADEQTQLAEDAYRKGQGEIQSVLRSREKRLQLQAAKIDALREFHLARIRHEAALGNFK